MTGDYFRPIPCAAGDWGSASLPLAGGWCHFEQVEVMRRDGPSRIVAAADIPPEIRDRLTAPRPDVGSVSMAAPQIMGILNVTPDSFSDGGRFVDVEPALAQARAMIDDGATIIDIGGESTRPGAAEIPVETEVARIDPLVAPIAERALVSIDTRKSEVAAAAVAQGAGLINDVSAATFDPAMARVMAESGLPVCLMHAQGDPQTMQKDPFYDNVLLDVFDFLANRIEAVVAAGVRRDRIVVDPGIGFGKTFDHNLALLRGLSLFHALGCPILLGASRKRFIGTLTGSEVADERVAGSVAVALHGARQGVQMLRVHDTKATKEALQVQQALI